MTSIWCSKCETELPLEMFTPSQRQPGNWCRSCRSAYMEQYRHAHPLPVAPCRDCGKTYQRWNGHWKSPSSGGAHRRCRDCYTTYWRTYQERQAAKVKIPRDPSTMTIKEMRSSHRMQHLRMKVLQEETNCGICGEYVDQTLSHQHKMSATMDHIIPLAFGGAPFDRSNVRLAHRSCNSSSGSKQRDVLIQERVIFARAGAWMGRFF